MTGRTWDASSYDRIGGPMTAMAVKVLDRLPLRGDEVVLDAGCGTGRVSLLLLDRLPQGRLLALDADPAMVAVAHEVLAEAVQAGRAEVRQADLLQLVLAEPVDAVFSTATFHWVLDHEALYRRLFAALAPGGRLVAQCGGAGNIATIRAVGEELVADARFAAAFAGWSPPWRYATPEEDAALLTAAGFTDVHTWLEPHPVVPDDPREYLRTIVLGAQVQRLGPDLGGAFIDAALERLPSPVTVDYVRLNLDATRPA